LTSVAAPCVIDASAILPIVDFEPCSPRAEQWFAAAQEHAADSVTVDLFDAECANGLWKRVRRESWSRDDAREALGRILDLPYRRIPLRAVIEDALDLAVTLELAVHDACYVALAVVTGLPLVTADRRLARAARAAGCEALCFTEDAPLS